MESEDSKSYKVCYSCKLELPIDVSTCFQCGKSAFAHNGQVEAKKTYLQFKREVIESLPTIVMTEPEFKVCPMCAEPIRFRARKCRFCGEMQQTELAP